MVEVSQSIQEAILAFTRSFKVTPTREVRSEVM